MQSVNLMPPGYVQRERTKRRVLVAGAVAVAVSLALFGLARLVDKRVAGEKHAKASAEEEIARLRSAQAELASYNSELKSLAEKIAFLRTLDHNRRWASCVARVAGAVNDHVLLTRLQVRPARPKLELFGPAAGGQPAPLPVGSGIAPTQADDESARPQRLILFIEGLALANTDITQFISALTATGVFERVTFKGSQTNLVNGKQLNRFELDCPVRYERPVSTSTVSEPMSAHATPPSQTPEADGRGTP